jgi:hypothetical protein
MSTSVLKFPSAAGIKDTVAALDWQKITASLDAHGCAVAESVLTPGECRALAGMYNEDGLFRSRIVMARHGFGRGQYKYWAYPLPAAGYVPVTDTRSELSSTMPNEKERVSNR